MNSSNARASYRRHWRKTVTAALLTVAGVAHADEGALFTGTTRLACEALLCLSSSAGSATGACNPALSHYFGISGKDLSETLGLRLEFLQQCPVANQTAQMSSLVQAIAQGAGRCDARSLNATLKIWKFGSIAGGDVRISNKLPAYCSAYANHPYTDVGDLPRYVGTVKDGGHWVEARDYDRALAIHNGERPSR